MKLTPKLYLTAILLLIAYLSLSAVPNTAAHSHSTICLFHNITGYPCPACGTTRGLKFFFHLDIYNSVMMNPLSTILGIMMIVAIPWLIYDIAMRKNTFIEFTRSKPPVWFVILAVLLTIANEYWNIQKGL